MYRSRVNVRIAGFSAALILCLAGGWFAGSIRAQAATSVARDSAAGVASEDSFLWLEDLSGPRALAWVKAENARTLAVLQGDPRFAGFLASAIKINESHDRIPSPQIVGGRVYNFWQDEGHVRGVWRTTTIADYANPQPAWKTVLDLDALAKTDGKKWVWKGADCDSPDAKRCLISLSEGGEDAVAIREFDLESGQFVADGFSLPRGKQSAAWAGEDTLLVSREWAPGELTTSGYPYVVKELKRGQPLASATEIFRGTKADVSVEPGTLSDGHENRAQYIVRETTTFESKKYLVTQAGLQELNLPSKSNLLELIAGRLLVRLAEPWNANGSTFPAGALVSLELQSAAAQPQSLKPVLLFAPSPRESIGEAGATRDHLVLTTYENVRGRAFVYTPLTGGTWSKRRLGLPDNSTIELVTADKHGVDAFLGITGFLQPTILRQLNTATGASSVAKALTPQFDASGITVEQFEATSKDGTRIPYFIVRLKNMAFDGSNPTILYAYGGFEISLTPYYRGTLGKLWLERGGVFVVANIRGGGEFGPAWHEAGLKTQRQRIFDDFAAVGQDLIAKKITSPRHLGIQGGSNGGLLMGVEFNQHPELWNAVDIQVPLLDMLRYEQIQAGASWVGEYGSVSNPDERAFLASISPYNNVKPGVTYPEPFIWTTTKDDRVGPQHARKFAAKLKAMGIPYLFYEVTEGGHGAGADIKERSFTTALEMTYFARKLMPKDSP